MTFPEFKTEVSLLELVRGRAQESLTLEFKRSDALKNDDDRSKIELAKDVAALATSIGGMVLYGVVENKHTHEAERIDQGVDISVFSKEWIEQVIRSRISPAVEGVTVDPIELKSTSPGRYGYAVTVPASERAPHMVNHRYYMRLHFSSVPMEDYQVRDVMSRRTVPRLEIEHYVRDAGDQYVLTFGVRNVGRVAAEDLYVEVEFRKDEICPENFLLINLEPVRHVRAPEPSRGILTHMLTYQQTEAPHGRGNTGYRTLPRLLFPSVIVPLQELHLAVRKNAPAAETIDVRLYARDMPVVQKTIDVVDLSFAN